MQPTSLYALQAHVFDDQNILGWSQKEFVSTSRVQIFINNE